MWVLLAPAAAVWFAAIVLVNVARSPPDTRPPEFDNTPTDTADTADTQDDNDQEGKDERESVADPPTPEDQC